jgi:hypothetical protein
MLVSHLLRVAREAHAPTPAWAVGCLGLLLSLTPQSIASQLRPIDPVDWRDFGLANGRVSVGVSVYDDHPAALAGTEGRLVEWGVLAGAARFGRVVVRVDGSAYRVLDERGVVGEPSPVVQPVEDGRRSDSGDYLISTIIRLAREPSRFDGALRFGVRLPTTDDRVGLERDRTDFFATVGGRYQRGRLGLSAEGGLGIFGVVGPRFDQTDPLLFAASVDYRAGRVSPSLQLVGQYDTRVHGPPLGNEHLAELRFGVKGGERLWFQLTGYRGLARFSPDYGLQVSLGHSF